ncbi:dihydrodipicolinate reductase [Litorimonas taeanensis]|uniref:4-hydroxy-tetrahydrodipicolinate reductase n=1 Tax=Litorimonas taeanensis TaxID=568099 RepID=A0A420WEA6_9PROT|nr:4-hydroxy-tetrahydrodipicolinate reductase [Litorimonas taeanensis]RKQ69359.1 dihydrodipicolinate reductase [Litorimonas taeanensis]
MAEKIKFAILGADGRMGQAIIKAATSIDGVSINTALTHSQSPHLGKDALALAGVMSGAGQSIVNLTDDLSQAGQSDVVIDFSAPQATLDLVDAIKGSAVKAVISGTTGFNAAQQKSLDGAISDLVFLQSGNFSMGVNMLEALVELATSKLRQGWDIEVLEMHHKRKVDAPSGTALMLGEAAAAGRDVKLGDVQVLSREGQTGARQEGDIGFATLRGGGVIGDHSVIIASELEKITLSHSAFDRSVFADGAVNAALWAVKQSPGHYNMKDVLGL